jgi:hypothetical protein
MLNWYQLEETAAVAQQEVVTAGQTALIMEEIGPDNDYDRGSIRSRLASAFVSLGVRLDPEVLTAEDAA